MHARARLASIASENIPQMVHPAYGEKEIDAHTSRVLIHTYTLHTHTAGYARTHLVSYTRCLGSNTYVAEILHE